MGSFKFGHKDHFERASIYKDVPLTVSDSTILEPIVQLALGFSDLVVSENHQYEQVEDNSKLLLENTILQLEQELKEKSIPIEKEVIKYIEIPKEVFITVEKIVEKEKPYYIEKFIDVIKEVPIEVKVIEEKIVKTFHIPLWYKIALGIETLIVITLLIK